MATGRISGAAWGNIRAALPCVVKNARVNNHFPYMEDEMKNAIFIADAVSEIVPLHTPEAVTVEDWIVDPETPDGLRDLDFLEIGTSNFNTISQMLDPPPLPVSDAAGAGVGAQAGDPVTLRGMAVEPSAEYLAQLPDRPGVLKVNAAIVSEQAALQGQHTVDFYFIPEVVIDSLHLPPFLKGCNAIGDYHGMHKATGLESHVQIAPVSALTVRELLTTHRVRRIRLLKVDAEGYDGTIMYELYHYLVARKDPLYYPERIVFESGEKSQQESITWVIAQLLELGYKVAFRTDDDTALLIVHDDRDE